MRTRAATYVVLSSLLWASPVALAQDLGGEEGRTFTTDADFALGTFAGTRPGAPSAGELRIETGASVPPFLWMANAGTGTVTKVDTRTGRQVARYDSVLTRNWDNSVPAVRPPRDGCNYPVVTAVDARGDAYVVNRTNCSGGSASITRYAGSLAYCVDRNGNGRIDTSTDVNADGSINLSDTAEFPGQADECILWTKNFAPAGDPGRAIVVDAQQNVWAAGFTTSKLYQLNGQTGAHMKTIDLSAETGVSAGIHALAIGPDGHLYTSDNATTRRLWKIDPRRTAAPYVVDTLTSSVPTFGLVVDGSGVAWLGADADSALGVVRADFAADSIQQVGGAGGCSGRTKGIAVDATGDIWAACWSNSRVLRLDSNGVAKSYWYVGMRPEGVAVASDGKIWATVPGMDNLSVIDPAVPNDVTAHVSGTLPYTYGDMTGSHHHRFVVRQGSWSVVHDSGLVGRSWGAVRWNQESQGTVPASTSITVEVRAANTVEALATQAFATATNNGSLSNIRGRYVELRATLRSENFGPDPVLSDLTILSGNQAPVAQCQDQNVCAGPTCTAQVSVNDGSYDPDGDAISLAQSPAGPYAIGSRAVSLTVSDASLSASCSASVRVRDCEPPAITCAEPVQAECTGNQSATVSAGGADATDSCSTVSVSGPGLASYPLGNTSVTYTATDAAGNTATCTTLVQVQDTLPPSITCPAPTTAECVGGGATNSGLGSASATDVCAPATVQAPGLASFPLGTTSLTWTATDTSGNAASCSAPFTVADTQAPALTLLGSTSQALECGSSYVDSGATASDACVGDLTAQVVATGTVNPGQPGSYTRTYSVVDPSGNASASVTRAVTVSDTQAPTLVLNGEAQLALECGSSYVDPGAQASDVCASDLSNAVVASGSVDVALPGTYTRTYSVADPAGNAAPSVTRTVTVTDTQGPSLALNGPASLTLDCSATFVDPGATAIDACRGDVSSRVTVTGSVDPTHAGSYVLTYGATDPSGNAATPVTRTVTVRDSQGPVIALNGPSPVLLECRRDTYSEQGATAVDGCAGALPVTIEQPVIDTNTPATYQVTYSAQASGGNVITATRQVIVQDTLEPQLTLNGAATIALECKVDTFTDPGATASDLCAGNRTSSIEVTGAVDTNVPGAYPLLYRVADGHGNSSEKVRDVKVVDTRKPTITLEGAAAPVMECSREAFVALGATATDLCAGDITHRITISGTQNIVAPGTYPITYNVTDPSGNAAESVTRSVTVRDTKAPVVTIRGEANMTLECGMDTYTELGATAYDACQGDMTSQLNTYGSGANPSAVGTYSIQYGVWDASGNTTMALRTVKVVDRLPPTLSLVGSATVRHECASGAYVDPGATAADACYGDLTRAITKAGSVNAWARGNYTLTYNVQDSALLKAATLTRTVQVVDTQAPTLECRENNVWPADQAMRNFSLSDCVTATDACDGFALPNNGTILSIYSDEPEDAVDSSDGSTTEDIVITGKSTFKLRAERRSDGDGRVYGVLFELKDQTGNARTGLCKVHVPLTEGGLATDSGSASGYTVVPPPPVARRTGL
ncbi:immunoglobulin-like domain-containing protein [Hyalangium gracile]|uniref:immunoglobulin-like domain-containing protein n=1 Tax=Hyalangium gracile TaxID=394092 RepID=UPI001CCEB1B3|nr:immunoglobulin-like domain-containing protein [Hyalangium gracile]